MLAAGIFCLIGLTTAAVAEADRNDTFTFAAIGDMPYELPGKPEKFERLIAAINRASPAFTVHTGDIISGQTRCSDEHFAQVRKLFDRFDSSLVFTPGDNEWTDCHRLLGGDDTIRWNGWRRSGRFSSPIHVSHSDAALWPCSRKRCCSHGDFPPMLKTAGS